MFDMRMIFKEDNYHIYSRIGDYTAGYIDKIDGSYVAMSNAGVPYKLSNAFHENGFNLFCNHKTVAADIKMLKILTSMLLIVW